MPSEGAQLMAAALCVAVPFGAVVAAADDMSAAAEALMDGFAYLGQGVCRTSAGTVPWKPFDLCVASLAECADICRATPKCACMAFNEHQLQCNGAPGSRCALYLGTERATQVLAAAPYKAYALIPHPHPPPSSPPPLPPIPPPPPPSPPPNCPSPSPPPPSPLPPTRPSPSPPPPQYPPRVPTGICPERPPPP
eukprot:4064349-Pleurochrysis_carterae.AAC.1